MRERHDESIIAADERLAEKRGAKILIVGPTGVGKTSLLRTLPDLDRALFIDIEAGDLAVHRSESSDDPDRRLANRS